MNQRDVKIKILKQNFIKKHKLNPDYFTIQQHHDWEPLQFCDRDLFHSKQAKNSCQIKPVSSIFKAFTHVKSHSIPTIITPAPENKFSRQDSPNQTNKTIQNRQLDYIKIKIKSRSNSVKGQKLKKAASNTKQQKKLPNYAVYIMKPCTVSPIKMQPRPVSAFTKLKKQLSMNSKPMKQASTSQRIHKKRSILYLQPWETDQNQF